MSIPKIIHQIWIGPNPRPSNFMQTWKDKHPDFEYIFWNDEEFEKRNMVFACQQRINEMDEWCGKTDIMRLEILYKYGGVYIDADSICIEPIDELLEKHKAFAGYENENVRQGLVANGTMGFPKGHPLCKDGIKYILNHKVSNRDTGKRAWQNTGPVLLTSLLNTNKFKDVSILPSYLFLPEHPSGLKYFGHSKVYAYQEWGSTKQNYNIMNDIKLAEQYNMPSMWVSVLVSSYNTNHSYICECLESIRKQNGHFGMEIVWINDGSNELSTKLLEKTLKEYEKRLRFCKFIYKKLDDNIGIGPSLHQGILLCTNELIIKVDSDDIISPDRIFKQINFMKSHPDCVMCGTDLSYFKVVNNNKIKCGNTNHDSIITWDNYKKNPSHWFISHPTLCYKKSAVLEVGNYNREKQFEKYACDDFELQLRILKKFKTIYNIKEDLLLYRIHDEQITAGGNSSIRPEIVNHRNQFIQKMIND